METKFDIVQKMVDDTHFYWVDGEFMPSVTHILEVAAPKEYGLLNFFKQNTPEDIESKSNAGKENGSLVHDACEKLLNGVEIPLKDYPYRSQKAIWSLKQWYDLVKPTSLITEQMVASKVYKYAGTLDLVCTVDSQILNSFDKGKRTSKTTRLLIDFKTNKPYRDW